MEEELKKALFELMLSHMRLATAEYRRDPKFNDQHFSYKAEEAMVIYLQKNEPDAFDEFLTLAKDAEGN